MNEQILLAINQGWAHPALDFFFSWITSSEQFGIPVMALIALFLGWKYGKQGWLTAVALVVLAAIADQLANLLKDWFQQARPCLELFDQIRRLDVQDTRCMKSVDGMPSSHALNFFAIFTFLALMIRNGLITVILFSIATLVGLSRIYLGVHYPDQVIAGGLFGLILGALTAYLVRHRLALMKKGVRHLFFTALLIAPLGLPEKTLAAELPPPFFAHYTIKKGFFELGQATREFRIDTDGRMEYISKSWATGVVSVFVKENVIQESVFLYENGEITPSTYYYESNKGRKVWQWYDWESLTAYSRRNDEVFIYDIPRDALDQNVYQLALMLHLADGKRDMTYHLAENKRLKTYPIRYLGTKTVDTLFGSLEVVVIQRDEGDVKTTLWCAKKLQYLPVRIDHKESGVQFSAYLDQLSGIKPNP